MQENKKSHFSEHSVYRHVDIDRPTVHDGDDFSGGGGALIIKHRV